VSPVVWGGSDNAAVANAIGPTWKEGKNTEESSGGAGRVNISPILIGLCITHQLPSLGVINVNSISVETILSPLLLFFQGKEKEKPYTAYLSNLSPLM
jgi:hypothetical protein